MQRTWRVVSQGHPAIRILQFNVLADSLADGAAEEVLQERAQHLCERGAAGCHYHKHDEKCHTFRWDSFTHCCTAFLRWQDIMATSHLGASKADDPGDLARLRGGRDLPAGARQRSLDLLANFSQEVDRFSELEEELKPTYRGLFCKKALRTRLVKVCARPGRRSKMAARSFGALGSVSCMRSGCNCSKIAA